MEVDGWQVQATAEAGDVLLRRARVHCAVVNRVEDCATRTSWVWIASLEGPGKVHRQAAVAGAGFKDLKWGVAMRRHVYVEQRDNGGGIERVDLKYQHEEVEKREEGRQTGVTRRGIKLRYCSRLGHEARNSVCLFVETVSRARAPSRMEWGMSPWRQFILRAGSRGVLSMVVSEYLTARRKTRSPGWNVILLEETWRARWGTRGVWRDSWRRRCMVGATVWLIEVKDENAPEVASARAHCARSTNCLPSAHAKSNDPGTLCTYILHFSF